MDYLHQTLSDDAIGAMSALALAHVGDAVYELLTRLHMASGGILTAKKMHQQTISAVCATAQAEASQLLLPHLTEEEQAVFRRGRNCKGASVPKSCSPAQYSRATGLEALFGYLYLKGTYERINALYQIILTTQEASS